MRASFNLFCVLCFQATFARAAGPGVPVFFMANQGQAPPAVRFIAKGSGLTAYFLRPEVLLHTQGAWVHIRFQGANPSVRLEGASPQIARANFLIGDASQWHRAIPTFGAVRYSDLYAGIDMIYGGVGVHLKSEFIVAPGADPAQIRIYYGDATVSIRPDGILSIAVGSTAAGSIAAGSTAAGSIAAGSTAVGSIAAGSTTAGSTAVGSTAVGSIAAGSIATGSIAASLGQGVQRLTEAAPYIYQELNGVKIAVEGHYTLHAGGSVGFSLGDYDTSRPLIIDPLIAYSTTVGATAFNAATAIAVDSAGAAYIAGYTDSDALPTALPAQNYNAGSVSVFVAKLNPGGSSLEYCTYMGGSGTDKAYGIAVDSNGAAYVTGSTTSPNFPTRSAEQTSLLGGSDAFVFKLNPMGDILLYSTYLGGSGAEIANGIAVDISGNAYIVGDTTSLNFPATGYQTANHGSQDAFVAKLSATGQQLLFSTYLGGAGADHGGAIAVDPNGSAYITGYTWSRNFPLANAFQTSIAGPCNAYIARLSSNGNSLMFSTYIGGSGCTTAYPETGQGIALDAQGDAYIAGVTSSQNFVVERDPAPVGGLGTDAFVVKVNSDRWSGYSARYMGGSGSGLCYGDRLGRRRRSIRCGLHVFYGFSGDGGRVSDGQWRPLLTPSSLSSAQWETRCCTPLTWAAAAMTPLPESRSMPTATCICRGWTLSTALRR